MNSTVEDLSTPSPQTYSKKDVVIRGAIYVLVAIIGFLLGDPWLRENVAKWVFTVLGAANVGLIAYRAFIDRTTDNEPKKEESQES